jgi:uncharacterized protein
MWIVWQCLYTVAARILIVWIYNNNMKSVFTAILFHAMGNVSVFLCPSYGSDYDPLTTGILIWAAAALAIFAWGQDNAAASLETYFVNTTLSITTCPVIGAHC